MVFSYVDLDIRTMHGHDVAVNTCSGDNLIASKSLPLRWEQCIVKDSKVTSLAGANEYPLSLSGVDSLAMWFGSTAYREHFTIGNRLGVSVLGRTRLLKVNLNTIDFERNLLVFKHGAVVFVLSSLT